MQAAGKSRQAANDASTAESAPDQAAGLGLQNVPGEKCCFLNGTLQKPMSDNCGVAAAGEPEDASSWQEQAGSERSKHSRERA